MRIWHVLIILLMCSPLLLPVVNSQSYVTVTTQVTSFQVITGQSQLRQLFNAAFRINATASVNGCQTFNLAFNSTQGQILSGNFTSDVPLGIFVTQDSNYQTWLKAGGCASFPSSVVSQPPTTTYAFNVTMPSSDIWDIVVLNYSTMRNADGFMSVYLSGMGPTSTETMVGTITATQTSLAQSVMTTSTTAVAPGIPGFPAESIMIGIILGLAALILLRRRR